MPTSHSEEPARARAVRTTHDRLIVELTDERTLSVPLWWYPRLLRASEDQRARWELLGGGEGIHWPLIDEDLSVAGLLRGTPSTETNRQTGRPA